MSHHGLNNEAIVVQIADAFCNHGLRLPALIGLEAGRPLTMIGGQLLWLIQPVLSLVVSHEMVSQVALMLEEPAAVEALIDELEARES